MALKSLSGRRKVVIPAYTCYSVPSAIAKAGLAIAPCDLRCETMDFDWNQLEPLLDDDTLCVVPTHLFGIPSDVERVRRLCEGKGIYVVEDAAQGLGVEAGGNRLGSLGDVSFFSLGRGKHITCGTGGVVATRSEEISRALRIVYQEVAAEPAGNVALSIVSVLLMTIFLRPGLYWLPEGMPILGLGESRYYKDFPVFRLSRFQAGLLRRWRETLAAFNLAREATGKYYRSALQLEGAMGIYSGDVPYLRFPVFFREDEERAGKTPEYGALGVRRMYPDSVNHIAELRDRFAGRSFGNSEKIARTLWTLPTHTLLRDTDKARICDAVRRAIDRLPAQPLNSGIN